MNTRLSSTRNILLAAAVAAALPAPAFAQGEPTALGAITVTARKREESLQDVPIAVTSVSGDALQTIGAQDLTAISQSVPNVTLENSRATNSTLTAFIRGVGQQDPVAGFEQGVGIYLDDVYLNRPQGAVLDVYDLDRIEVLRGPQGTLYGRNTIGGAVKYVTRPIDRDNASMRARLVIGTDEQIEGVFAASAPVSETFRIGGAVAKLTRDGFGRNLTTGDENYDKDVLAARVSLEFEPAPSVLVRLSADHVQDDSAPRQGYRLLPTVSPAQPALLPGDYDTLAGITTFGPIRRNKVEATGGQLRIEWSPSEAWKLQSITAYREDDSESPIDFDSTQPQSFDAPVVYQNDQLSQELQLTYSSGRMTVVGGAYYLDANAFNAFDVVFTSATSFTLGDVDTRTWALFGEATFDLSDVVSLSIGGRYTEDERTSRVVRETFLGVNSPYFGNSGAISITPPVIVGGQQVVPEFNGKRTDSDFTPRVILAWQPNEDLNLYASYAEGFKGGGFDPRGNYANADVRRGFLPETVESYEIGAKASFMDGRAQVNTAVFFADYTDVQIPGSVIVPGPPVSFVGTVTNAGAAEMTGVEVEASALFTERLTGSLSFGYIDAKYTEFVVNGVDVSNQRDVQNTPDWTGNASLTYAVPLSLGGASGTLALTGSAAFRDDTQQFEFAIPLLDQSAYWLYDASVNWTTDDGRWRLGIHGRNLGDKRYITSGYNFPGAATDNSVLAFYGNPRTVSAAFEYRF
ncbi:MAG: TonB-dependent receptor [Steroidobacteraceae bacterium]|nr:TonB-dependent receptor [Steroidobacteraceae bacterium]